MRRAALFAVTATLCFCAAPSPASADLGGTLCSLSGWVSGVVGKVCNVARHAGGVISAGQKLAGGHVGGAIGALTGGGVAKAAARSVGLAAVAAAVVAGAQYALEQTGRLIGSTETPRLGTTWFSAYYWRMAAVSALLTLPFLCAAAIQAMLRSDISLLVRSAFGYLPLGMLAVGVAAPLTGLLLAGSDEMSAIVSAAAGHADTGILDRAGLVGLIAAGSKSLFVAFFVALFTVAAAVTLWLELLDPRGGRLRDRAHAPVVLRRDGVAGATDLGDPRGRGAHRPDPVQVRHRRRPQSRGAALGHTLLPGFQALFAGTTLVLLAAFSPWAMLRLLPLHELAGAAVGGLRPLAGQPPLAADDRAQAATDASNDVAAESVARVLARMPRNRAAGAGDAAEASPATAAAAAAGRAFAPDATGTDAEGVAAGSAGPLDAAGAENVDGARAGDAVMDAPREDAFGSTVRSGHLPRLFRAGSRWRTVDLSAEGLRSGEPLLDEDTPEPEPAPPPDADRLPEPLPDPERDPLRILSATRCRILSATRCRTLSRRSAPSPNPGRPSPAPPPGMTHERSARHLHLWATGATRSAGPGARRPGGPGRRRGDGRHRRT